MYRDSVTVPLRACTMSVVLLVVLYMHILAPYHTLPQDYMHLIKASPKIIFTVIFE